MYEAFDELKPIAFSHQESAYAKHCNCWKCCLDRFLQDEQTGFHVPRTGDVEVLSGQPWWSFRADRWLISFKLELWMVVRLSSTYPFNCWKHMHSGVSVQVWVQICIDHIRIDINCHIVVMIPWERLSNIVFIVATLCSSLLAFESWYRFDPFQELNRRLELRRDNQEL